MLVTARLGCTSARPAIHGTVTDKRFQIAISRKGVKPDKVWTTISKEEFENTKVGEKWYGTYDP